MPPLPPGNVQVSGVTTRSATVTWHHSVVTFLNDLTSISGYRVIARQTSFNISDLVVELLPTQLSYSFPSTLEEFTMYTCQVYAKNSFGYGTASQTVQFKTLQASEYNISYLIYLYMLWGYFTFTYPFFAV